MSDIVQIELLPLGKSLRVRRGTPLRDVLFAHGVEFPCGGHGRCKGCKVKLLSGLLPVTDVQRQKLDPVAISEGWRLGCCGRADSDLKIELAQWEAAILADDSSFPFRPREGLGIAVDIGTTTIAAQLLDLRTAGVLAVRTALNSQARHGADVMSRVEFAVASNGQKKLEQIIRTQIGRMISELLRAVPATSRSAPGLTDIVLVGNTVMHHLFSGISLEPLSHYPFEPEKSGLQIFRSDALNWKIAGNPFVRFLPCLGSFVGSDILAGVLATRLHETNALTVLIDLGTNGEIVLGNRERMLCASTAAGPAFEGARISAGMRAATGAISEVWVECGEPRCRVLGNVTPRGICGSGLVDAVAAGLSLGRIQPTGRLKNGESLPLSGRIFLNQHDVRELQLAKGAIAAGINLLLQRWGATKEEVSTCYLAGAFGNYLNLSSAKRIGLLNFPSEKVQSAGNTALLGAKLALFGLPEQDGSYADVLRKTSHVSLNEEPSFQDAFVAEMGFPPAAGV